MAAIGSALRPGRKIGESVSWCRFFAAYLYLDLRGSTMRYGAAGHPPLLWWHHSECAVEAVVEVGLPLGLLPVASYTSIQRPIASGDRFLLYTDGLLEASNEANEFFGEARIRELVCASHGLPPDQSLKSLLVGVSQWSGKDRGRPAEDDLTVVMADLKENNIEA